MPDVKRKLEIEASANVGGAVGSLQRLAGKVSDAGESVAGANRSFQKIGSTLTSFGTLVSTAFTLPFFAAGAAALKFSKDQESAFAGVRKTITDTEAGYKNLRAELTQLSETIPASFVDLAGIAEIGGQLGIARESVVGFTETIQRLGDASNLVGEEGATALARFINVSSATQSQVSNVASTIVALGNNSATTEAEIANLATRIGASGTLAGLSSADILGFSAAISSVGLTAELGGTNFSKFVSDLVKAAAQGGSELQAFAAIAGQSAAQFRQNFETDAAGAIQTFIQGLSNIEAGGGSAVVALDGLGVKSTEMSRLLTALAGNTDLLASSLSLASDEFDRNEALLRESNERYKTFESALKLLRSVLSNTAAVIGDKFRPVLRDIINEVVPIITRFREWVSELSPLQTKLLLAGTAIAGIAAVLGPVLIVAGQAIGSVQTLAAGFGTLSAGAKAAPAAISSAGSAVAGLGGVFAKVVPALSTVGTFLGGLGPRLAGLIPAVAGFVASSGGIAAAFSAAGAAIAPFLLVAGKVALIAAAIVAALDLVNIAIGIVIQNWDSITSTITEAVAGAWTTVANSLVSIWGGIIAAAESIFPGITETISSAWSEAVAVAQGIWDALTGFLRSAWEGIASAAASIWGGIQDIFSSVFEAWRDAPRATDFLIDALKGSEAAADKTKKAAEELNDAVTGNKKGGKGGRGGTVGAFSGLGDAAEKAGRKIARFDLESAKAQAERLNRALGKLASDAMARASAAAAPLTATLDANTAALAAVQAQAGTAAQEVIDLSLALSTVVAPLSSAEQAASKYEQALKRLGVDGIQKSRLESQQLKEALDLVRREVEAGERPLQDLKDAQEAFAKATGDTVTKSEGLAAAFENIGERVGNLVNNVIGDLASGKNPIETIKGFFGEFKKQILSVAGEQVIGSLIKGIGKFIDTIPGINQVSGAFKNFASVLGGGSGAAGGVASSVTGAFQAFGSAVSGVISAVSGAISAVTDIIGVFQNARQNKLLSRIEESTRRATQFLGDRGDGGITTSNLLILEESRYITGNTDEMKNSLWDTVDLLGQIRDAVQDLEGLGGGPGSPPGGGGGGAGGGGTTPPEPTAPGPGERGNRRTANQPRRLPGGRENPDLEPAPPPAAPPGREVPGEPRRRGPGRQFPGPQPETPPGRETPERPRGEPETPPRPRPPDTRIPAPRPLPPVPNVPRRRAPVPPPPAPLPTPSPIPPDDNPLPGGGGVPGEAAQVNLNGVVAIGDAQMRALTAEVGRRIAANLRLRR